MRHDDDIFISKYISVSLGYDVHFICVFKTLLFILNGNSLQSINIPICHENYRIKRHLFWLNAVVIKFSFSSLCTICNWYVVFHIFLGVSCRETPSGSFLKSDVDFKKFKQIFCWYHRERLTFLAFLNCDMTG